MITMKDLEKPDLNMLAHYGVLGMKWGHRKTEKEHGLELLKKAKTSNMERWGADSSHNILYITGYSGSGKSTIARSLSDANTNVIHLDSYFEKMDKNVAASIHDKDFESYLDKHFPDYKSIANPKEGQRHSKEWWNKVDKFMSLTEDFSKQQFSKNKKVIIEGVQLSDSTTYPDKNFFKDKPLVIVGTNPLTSFARASRRDENAIIKSVQSAKEYVQWYSSMSKSLASLEKVADVKRGSEWVTSYLKNH